LTATEAVAAEVYTLEAMLVGVREGNNESAPKITIELPEYDGEVDVEVDVNCRFIATTWNLGQQVKQITFAEFIERFVGERIEFDFVENKSDYLVIECRNVLILAN